MRIDEIPTATDTDLAYEMLSLDRQYALGDDEIQAFIGARRRAVRREIELRQRAAQRARGDMRGGEDY